MEMPLVLIVILMRAKFELGINSRINSAIEYFVPTRWYQKNNEIETKVIKQNYLYLISRFCPRRQKSIQNFLLFGAAELFYIGMKFHYCVQKIPPLVSVMFHMNRIHTFPSYFHKIHFYIILPSTPMSSEWSLPFRFSGENCVRHLSRACYIPHPSHPPFDHAYNITFATLQK